MDEETITNSIDKVNMDESGYDVDLAKDNILDDETVNEMVSGRELVTGQFDEITYTDDGCVVKEYTRAGDRNVLVYEETIHKNGNIIERNYVDGETNYYYCDGFSYRKIRTEFDNGAIQYFDRNGKPSYQEKKDGTIVYYDELGKPYYRVENEDGSIERQLLDDDFKIYYVEHADKSKEYLTDDDNLIVYPDGTYIDGNAKGTYTVDARGNIICNDGNGNQIFYDKYGKKYKIIYENGVVDDVYKSSQIETKNGKTTYSKINHIEYDEEAYNKILKTLNEIDGTSIENKCSDIVNTVNSFLDKCSTSGIAETKSDVNKHMYLVKSLSETTNYSLLAYEACDEELRDGLYLLIDSLFGENELGLATRFKKTIRETIEDRDNDNILEYKEGTNFKAIANNEIISSIYTDSDGNKWYLNRNNTVIKVEGNNLKINYGGETFNLVYDENGIPKLIDASGNALDIFGKYNLESSQFGGNQNDIVLADENKYVDTIINKYLPNLNREGRIALLDNVRKSSCGNVAMTNLVFKKFEGKEEEFYKTFGYPMYDIKYDPDSGTSVDYNYEPLILDLYCHEELDNAFGYGEGTDISNINGMEKYLKEVYNVSLEGYTEPYTLCGVAGYDLYEMDGTLYCPNGRGHAMLIVGETDDERYIVSSWGKKYIMQVNYDYTLAKLDTSQYYLKYN